MQERRKEALTQDGLVAQLCCRGYGDVAKRRISDWRANDLLPPFDLSGAGRGRGRGRESSSWIDGELVLDQAIWVCELLQLYREFNDLYLPLWMLGYGVPLSRIRQALAEPLQEMALVIQAEAGTSGDLEDIIGDAAYGFCKTMQRATMDALQMPQEALEAFVNILFNSEYDLSDVPFQQGVEALQEWELGFQRARVATQVGKIGEEALPSSGGESANYFFSHAPFFKEYLSLQQLKRAVDECTDNELQVVGRDLEILREMALSIRKMVLILARDMPSELRLTPKILLPAVFCTGRVFVLADLSLRRNGFAQVIDGSLNAMLSWLRGEVNEKLELELAVASQDFAASVKTCLERITEAGAKTYR